MRPLFTIHAGEYLVGLELEKQIKSRTEGTPKYDLWIPSKDTGIDLLLRDVVTEKSIPIQVKFSKDFNTNPTEKGGETLKQIEKRKIEQDVKEKIKGTSWFSPSQSLIMEKNRADFWVFVIFNFASKQNDFVIIPIKDLKTQVEKFNEFEKVVLVEGQDKKYHSYITTFKEVIVKNIVTSHSFALQTRGLSYAQILELYNKKSRNEEVTQDLTKYLNNNGWNLLFMALIDK